MIATGGSGNGGGQPQPAEQVYVEFSDRDRVAAEIVGFDPDADLALLKVDPAEVGEDLTVLPVSDRDEYAVGEPVAAIGSPFGERQSLSVGIVSAIDRSIESLSQFSIDNAIQTDASINPGNSGGPLLDGNGEVIGVNQQIQTSSGTNSGVGFAIPATAIRFSLDQLREDGDVDYAYLGVSTQGIWPQLADELGLDVETGALIADVVEDGPADDAGLQGSDDQRPFQGAQIDDGGDVIVAVDGNRLERESDLAELISRQRPGPDGRGRGHPRRRPPDDHGRARAAARRSRTATDPVHGHVVTAMRSLCVDLAARAARRGGARARLARRRRRTPARPRAATSPSRSTSGPRPAWSPSWPSARPRSPSTPRTAGWSHPSGGDAEWVLIVDPIDGTRPAAAGLESCCVSIAAARLDDEPTMGDVEVGCILELGKSGDAVRGRARQGTRARARPLADHRRSSACSGPTACAAARPAR